MTAIQALDRLYGQAERWYDLLQILEREVELVATTGETVSLKYRIGQLWEKELRDLGARDRGYREALEIDGDARADAGRARRPRPRRERAGAGGARCSSRSTRPPASGRGSSTSSR